MILFIGEMRMYLKLSIMVIIRHHEILSFELLFALLEIDLNQKLEDEWTPISLAASVGNYDLVEKLFEMGADIDLNKGIFMSLFLCVTNTEE